jgi:DNA polymerase gamma 1
MHGLDPSEASVLPDTAFTLPPLQGTTIAEHFHRIGTRAAHPWFALATSFAYTSLPPKPEQWDTQQSGWTKYHYRPDGSSFSEHVPYPERDDAFVFDVETMPNYHPYAVLACAASRTAWYAWISPWLLGETDDPQQLIPFGNPMHPRVIVGHNVSYDRARIREEYAFTRTGTRFIDTMALHVAVRGISSHQRPAWVRHRRKQQKAQERREEAVEAVEDLLRDVKRRQANEDDDGLREELRRIRLEMEESLPQLQADEDTSESDAKRWENLTSANSLADVARLHCGIAMDKEVRNDFMTHTPAEIVDNLHDYMNYCATDVQVTHDVFSRVLPAFLEACPSPVTFSGVLTMGSSFLPVNATWERYLTEAERVYRELEAKVKKRLVELTENARNMMDGGEWKKDVWLNQLDWTPKAAGPSRGVHSTEEVCYVSCCDVCV